MTDNPTLIVDKSDYKTLALKSANTADLEAGFIRVQIGPFALTANNITYMVTGDHIGYWKFFDPSEYGIDAPGYGRMPVWGYGQVTESKCDDIDVGTKLYGFFPVAQSLDMRPVKIGPLGFRDGAPHRTGLHPVYNSYSLIDHDPSFGAYADLQPVLRPLFTTSFLIDDFLADEHFFGADQVLLLSASSKTAMGTAYCLKQRGSIKVTGLTSGGNTQFVGKTGFYDNVYAYDDIGKMDAGLKMVIVDMAGNGNVNAALYDHFEDNIVYNCMVGKSHWQGAPPPKSAKGAPPIMFFAPDRAKQRFADWGAQGFAKNLAARWLPFCENASGWLEITEGKGVDAFTDIYSEFLNGSVDPAKGYLFSL